MRAVPSVEALQAAYKIQQPGTEAGARLLNIGIKVDVVECGKLRQRLDMRLPSRRASLTFQAQI